MKSDLKFPKVTGVEVAAVKRVGMEKHWDMYLINQNEFALKNVLISSRGYGRNEKGQSQKTSILRHMIEILEPATCTVIEPIQKEVLHLTNEYWVSYYVGNEIYDKKYIFLPDSIQDKHLIPISGFNFKGVVHK
jgi:hypothetical protein